jgi:hypothetical protein
MAYYIEDPKTFEALFNNVDFVLNYIKSIDPNAWVEWISEPIASKRFLIKSLCSDKKSTTVQIAVGDINKSIIINPIIRSDGENVTKEVYEYLSSYLLIKRNEKIENILK